LYGSQAIGGVINVITRSGRGAGSLDLEGEGGSYGTGRAHVSVGGELDALRYIGSVSYYDTNGFSAADRANGNSESDGYNNLAYNARVDYEFAGGAGLRGYARGFDGDVQFDGFDIAAGPVDALRNVQSTRETYAGVAAGYGNDSFATDAELSVSDATLESATPDDFFSRFALDSSIYEIDWQNEVSLPAGQRLTAGVEYRREQATIESVSAFGSDGYDEHVGVAGLYAQDRVKVADRANLTGGLRYEHHSAFGGKWTGRGTGTVELSDALRLHGSLGSAFKAPTLNDLYYPGYANPDLRPESSVGLDIGIEAAGRGVRADVTYFRNDITDLIQFDAATSRPENIGAVLAQGLEVAIDAAAGARMTLSGDYTFTSAIPDGADGQLARRPRHQGGVRATWRPAPGLRAFGELHFEAGRFDSGTGGRVQMSSFAIVNLAADYVLSQQVRLRGRIENLFDTEYQEVIGYGTAGISGYVGMSLALARN
jgi:vitamin B12 transporter